MSIYSFLLINPLHLSCTLLICPLCIIVRISDILSSLYLIWLPCVKYVASLLYSPWFFSRVKYTIFAVFNPACIYLLSSLYLVHCLCCTKLAFLTCWIHYIFAVFNPASITCRIHCIFAVFNPACMYPLSFTCLILCLRCIQTWLSHVLNTLLLRCVQPGLHMFVVFTYLIHCLFLYQLWLFSRVEYTASSLYSTRLYHELNTLHPRCIQSGFLTC